MELAIKLLSTSSKSIEEIALQSGFSGLSGFSRSFKQEFNSTPSEYRKKTFEAKFKSWNWKIPLDENDLNYITILKKKHTWLEKLFAIVINNFDNELFSIEELSNELFMSSSNLTRKTQQVLEVSTMKLVRDLRLQCAAELLNLHNKSVTEAASIAGFFDSAHLSRYFKKEFGCTPGEYRNITPFFQCIEKLKEEMNQIDN